MNGVTLWLILDEMAFTGRGEWGEVRCGLRRQAPGGVSPRVSLYLRSPLCFQVTVTKAVLSDDR